MTKRRRVEEDENSKRGKEELAGREDAHLLAFLRTSLWFTFARVDDGDSSDFVRRHCGERWRVKGERRSALEVLICE